MSYRPVIIELTKQAHLSVINSARAVPQDKMLWKVDGVGRTVLDMVQEIAKVPDIAREILIERRPPPFSEERIRAVLEERGRWKTLDECEQAMSTRLDLFYSTIESFPEEDLELKIVLPFDPSKPYSMANIMAYPYWNATYHLGQIGFIQTLYGDARMYF